MIAMTTAAIVASQAASRGGADIEFNWWWLTLPFAPFIVLVMIWIILK